MHGGSRVAEVLLRHGVRFVFTLVGGHISPILVGCTQRGIRVIDVRHEVTTVFAADAVARLSGVPGVAIVTAGPGVTNTLTAIKNAQLAHSPLVLIGGATATMLRGRGALQDIDQLALLRPHVKWSARPNRLKDVVPALEEAFVQAQAGVPGPVFVELAVDLLYPETVVREWYSKTIDKPNKNLAETATSIYLRGHLRYIFGRAQNPTYEYPPPPQIPRPGSPELRQAVKRLQGAERPVLVVGSQAMLRPSKVQRLVQAIERMQIPVYLSGMARGLLGRGHPLQVRHKRRMALREADVVVLAGVPCDFRLDYGAHVARAEVIGINLSAEELHKNRRPDVAICADPHSTLLELSRRLGDRPGHPSWVERLRERDEARNAEIRAMGEALCEPLNPLALCEQIEAQLDENSILVGDGGDFVATASYIVSPRAPLSWLDPGVFGTLGVGAGFALGAKLVRPDADVWLLYGDGAAGFSIMEYDTFARHGIPVISVVGNDAGWTQIERDQIEILGDDVACRLTHMDYHKVAEACGGAGIHLSSPEQVEPALEDALRLAREGQPVLINALIGKTDFRKGSISM